MASDYIGEVASITTALALIAGGLSNSACNQADVGSLITSSEAAYVSDFINEYDNLSNQSIRNISELDKSLPIQYSDEAKELISQNNFGYYVSEICYRLGDYFPGCRVVAESIYDFDGQYSFLKLYVVDETSVEAMLNKLEEFENDWWLSSETYETGKIFVDVMPL